MIQLHFEDFEHAITIYQLKEDDGLTFQERKECVLIIMYKKFHYILNCSVQQNRECIVYQSIKDLKK